MDIITVISLVSIVIVGFTIFGCDFCGKQYRFDAVDSAQIFAAPGSQPPVKPTVQ